MRSLLALLLLAPVAVAQTAEEKKATLAFIESLRDKDTGAFKVVPDGKPTLRACNGATKAIKVLGGELADKDKVAKFVLSCYDEKAGTFADPGTKADVASTAIGVIVACELGIPKDKLKAAMDYIGKNAKEFEEVRISAAAVEAWGVKDCPFDVTPWIAVGSDFAKVKTHGPRETGSGWALSLRLGMVPITADKSAAMLVMGLFQDDDGGWKKTGAMVSDIETTYRVMRAIRLFGESPKDEKKLREFLASHRNKDGGYATEPGKASSMSGVYYNAIMLKWLDDMGKK